MVSTSEMKLETETETQDSCESSVNKKGNLLARISTCINFDNSVNEMFKTFSKSFFENNFFWFIAENIPKEFELKKVRIMILKLLERGLLVARCPGDFEKVKSLGMIIQYNRLKKLKMKKSKLNIVVILLKEY